jgi:hypothetical protein
MTDLGDLNMKRFHFSLGDSTTGPIGFCASVYAESAEEAAQMLNDALSELGHSVSTIDNDEPDDSDEEAEPYIEYVEVYFNPVHGVEVTDIDETEDVDSDDE